MYRKIVSFTYLVNIIAEGFFCLAMPIAMALLGSWLLVSKASCPSWVYIPLVLLGVAVGFVSMCRFIIRAMDAVERIEKARSEAQKNIDRRNGRKPESDASEFRNGESGSGKDDV